MINFTDIKSCLLRAWILLLSPIIYLMVLVTYVLVKIAKAVFAKKSQ
jgi:hypothetical protein